MAKKGSGKKRKTARRKTGGSAGRLGRAATRFFIALTAFGIAVYLLPLSNRIVDQEADDTAYSAPAGGEVQVRVLNGCGEPAMALRVARFLRARGCDVVEMGNADHFHHKTTRVIDSAGDPEKARRVRDALGVGTISSHPDSTLLLDVTVLIGKDCVPFPPPGAAPEAEATDGEGARR